MLKSNIRKSFSRLIKIDYSDLNSNNLFPQLEDAFGLNNGLGVICIKGIPKFESVRFNLLYNGFKLANLNQSIHDSLERKETNYIYGWSKAKSATHETKDYRLACFYQKASKIGDQVDVWPDNFIPNFKQSFHDYCDLVTNCQIKLLKHLDDYACSKSKFYIKNTLYNSCSPLNNAIGRLLMYYPDENNNLDKRKKELIGWHRDVANLTALPYPMYLNKNGEIQHNVKSGIVVKDKNQNEVEIEYNEDELIIQIGDLGFILSGGCLISTPHCAMNSQNSIYDLYRITIALFMEPQENYYIKIPDGISPKTLFESDPYGSNYRLTSWTGDTTYKDFLMKANDIVYKN